ncbi:glycosyltransferase [Pseudomonas sp. S49]|uniref:glycosyltransferase n=1 Tax=Pseudomonas sp. S49 TaxID=1573720 RepID=UPI00132E9118|nr:glycosyltransferase [Pseudomonas sp. S49]QHF49459.1 hypothetical protein PspS49_07395 [Pseudomonas sp. S49]
MNATITAVIPVMGDYRQVQPLLVSLVKAMATDWPINDTVIDLLFVGDGDHWAQVADVAGLRKDHHVRYVSVAQKSTPACLFNAGAELAKGEFLAFLWPGVDAVEWLASMNALVSKVEPGDFLLAGDVDKSSVRTGIPGSWLCNPSAGMPNLYPTGWLELSDYLPMANCLVERASFLKAGGFSTSVLLQRGFWWEFTLRYGRAGRIRAIEGVPCASSVWSWHEYPLTHEVVISGDLVARRVMRAALVENVAPSVEVDFDDAFAFSQSLNSRTRAWLLKQISCTSREFDEIVRKRAQSVPEGAREPLRITVLGGPGEPAHNQLCFFNYFALLEKDHKLTWRTVLDTAAHTTDLVNSDIVIFSRIKSEEGCRLMDFCVATGISTIYMLDDNWFTVGKDWPVYAELFHEDSPIVKTFRYCLERASIALTYNQLLLEDMRPHSRTVELLPTNIELSEFNPLPRQDGRRKIVGYVGSPRPDDVAFRALAAVARRRDDFDVMYMGAALPECFADLPEHRLKQESYVFGYRRYAAILSGYAPDVLLAPLGGTRFDASKCPNKFLEISAVGAAGIYSNVEPYISVVQSAKTGLFAYSNQSSWEDAIERLLDDDTLRSDIQKNAYKKVQETYATENVLPHFEMLLHRAYDLRGVKPSTERQRVAFVSHSPYQAGAERALVNFVCNLNASIEPIVVFPLGAGPMLDLVLASGLPVIQSDYDFAVPRVGDQWHLQLEDARHHDYVGRFGRVFRELELDGVVVNTNVLQSAVYAAAVNLIPVVLHSHGVISSRLDTRLCAKRWPHDDAEQLDLASGVICPSQLVADAYVDLYLTPGDKFHVVPNGTDCESWEPLPSDSHPQRFSMLCTLEPNKNVPMFLEAAQQLMSAVAEPIEFHIYGAGSGEYVEFLNDLVKEKALQNCVFFHSKTANVNDVYDSSRAIIVTSQLESFSFVTIEAMSRGRPVISTRCGGPEAIIEDGKTGFLINKNDSAALARLMLLIHRDDALAQRMGANARTAVEQRFEIKVIANAYCEVLTDIFPTASFAHLREKRRAALHFIGTRQAIAWSDTTLSLKNYPVAVASALDARGSGWDHKALFDYAVGLEVQAVKLKQDAEVDRVAAEMNRRYAIYNANTAPNVFNGLAARIYRRFGLEDDLWDLVGHPFSAIKRFCNDRHERGATKLLMTPDLRDFPYIEYELTPNQPYQCISTPIHVPAANAQGTFGIEIVNGAGQILHQDTILLADTNAGQPVEFYFDDLKLPVGEVCRLRLFARDAEVPVCAYELVTRRFAGLKAPARTPFLALM